MVVHVVEPSAPTEFEVQATLFYELRRLHIQIRGEVVVQLGLQKNRRATARPDLAVFEDGALAGIIEVKARQPAWKNAMPWSKTRQGARYRALSNNVILIHGMDEARDLIESVRASGFLDWARWAGRGQC